MIDTKKRKGFFILDTIALTELIYDFNLTTYLNLVKEDNIPEEFITIFEDIYCNYISQPTIDYWFIYSNFVYPNLDLSSKYHMENILKLYINTLDKLTTQDSLKFTQDQINDYLKYFNAKAFVPDILTKTNLNKTNIINLLAYTIDIKDKNIGDYDVITIAPTKDNPFTSNSFYEWIKNVRKIYPNVDIIISQVPVENPNMYSNTLKQTKKILKLKGVTIDRTISHLRMDSNNPNFNFYNQHQVAHSKNVVRKSIRFLLTQLTSIITKRNIVTNNYWKLRVYYIIFRDDIFISEENLNTDILWGEGKYAYTK